MLSLFKKKKSLILFKKVLENTHYIYFANKEQRYRTYLVDVNDKHIYFEKFNPLITDIKLKLLKKINFNLVYLADFKVHTISFSSKFLNSSEHDIFKFALPRNYKRIEKKDLVIPLTDKDKVEIKFSIDKMPYYFYLNKISAQKMHFNGFIYKNEKYVDQVLYDIAVRLPNGKIQFSGKLKKINDKSFYIDNLHLTEEEKTELGQFVKMKFRVIHGLKTITADHKSGNEGYYKKNHKTSIFVAEKKISSQEILVNWLLDNSDLQINCYDENGDLFEDIKKKKPDILILSLNFGTAFINQLIDKLEKSKLTNMKLIFIKNKSQDILAINCVNPKYYTIPFEFSKLLSDLKNFFIEDLYVGDEQVKEKVFLYSDVENFKELMPSNLLKHFDFTFYTSFEKFLYELAKKNYEAVIINQVKQVDISYINIKKIIRKLDNNVSLFVKINPEDDEIGLIKQLDFPKLYLYETNFKNAVEVIHEKIKE